MIEDPRGYFTEYGYADSALEDIATEAKLTRGALYHYFKSKKGLFHVVLEAVQKDIVERIETEAALWITQMPDYEQALAETKVIISNMLNGFRS